MSRSAGCRAGWAGGSLADAIRLAGQVAAVGRFEMIVGWRRASAYDPATERRASAYDPATEGRASASDPATERRASVYDPATERRKRGMGSGVWALAAW